MTESAGVDVPLKPILRRFVAGLLGGEIATAVVRRLRPELRRPDLLASRWIARDDVKAALRDPANPQTRSAIALEKIEKHLGELVAMLRQGRAQ